MDNTLKDRINHYFNVDENTNPKIPKNILIELTNMCNQDCVFCANFKMNRKKGQISEAFLYRMLKEAYDAGVREIGFYATGEPFVSKNLHQYIRKAKKIGYDYVYITTNGALATPDIAKKVIDSGLDSIKFSLNAGTRDLYEKTHGRDDFDKVIDNLHFIKNYRDKENRDFKIYISSILSCYTENQEELIKQKFKDLVDDIIFLDVLNQCGMMYEINLTLTRKNKNNTNKKSLPCPLLFNSLHITYEGYLTACCADFDNYLVVDDLNTTSLKAAWHNERFVKLREQHLSGDIKGTLCYNCIYNKNERINPLIQKHATKSKEYKMDYLVDRIMNRFNYLQF